MRRVIRQAMIGVVVGSALLVAASAQAAPGPAPIRQYADRGQKAFTVTLKVRGNRLQSGLFLVREPTALKCTSGDGSWVPEWNVDPAPVLQDGSFRAEGVGTLGEDARYRLVIKGVRTSRLIHGSVRFRLVSNRTEGTSECWSGRSEQDAAVPFVARPRG